MALPEIAEAEELVRKSLFDEAMALGNKSAKQANLHAAVSHGLIEAVASAIEMLKCGRASDARAVLERVVKASEKLLR